MGEIEGLAADEALPKRLERHAFDRLIMLSDGVFAIAITLAALEIRPERPWTDLTGLWSAVRQPVYGYLISFAVVSAYWVSHRDIFARLRRVDGVLTGLNLGLLFAIALLPTTTRMMYAAGTGQTAATQLYALSLALIATFWAVMWGYAAFRPGLMLPSVGWGYRIARLGLAFAMTGGFVWLAVAGVRAQTQTNWLLISGFILTVAVGRQVLMRLRRARPA